MLHTRKLIIHYHLFKNAGTSVDANLRRIFGEGFSEVEFGGPADLFTANRLIQLLEDSPQVSAVSSHTITLPLPVRDNWFFLPIIFLRHPLDRILSMYRYEKTQVSDSPGALLAKKWEFPDYVAARLSAPQDVVLRNWQTCWLARDRVNINPFSKDDETLLEQASRVIEDLPFVGVVERFAKSLGVLNQICSDLSISADFRVEEKNRSAAVADSLSERLKIIRNLLGAESYEQLEYANSMDIRLHGLALRAIEDRCGRL